MNAERSCYQNNEAYHSQKSMKPQCISVTYFKKYYGCNIRIKAVGKYIYKFGIYNYANLSNAYLMLCHTLNRERWDNMHNIRSVDNWATILFSDESRFTLKPTKLSKRVWRKKAERFKTITMHRGTNSRPRGSKAHGPALS